MSRISASLFAGIVIATTGFATAAVVSVGGAVVQDTLPADVREGAKESSTVIFLMSERQGVLLSSDVAVDVVDPGTYDSTTPLTPGSILAGTLVDSFLIHFDQIGTTGFSTQTGSVEFDREVLGLIMLSDNLLASDSTLGNAPATLYDVRSIDLANDVVTLSADRRTVSFTLRSSVKLDELRIVTNAIPLPRAAYAGFGLLAGLGVAGALTKWRKAHREPKK